MTPGDHNALGLVKVIFPNLHDVYLHDTNAKPLFKRDIRAFSHGCVRVHEPLDLAAHIVANDRGWTFSEAEEYVDDEVDSGFESVFELLSPVPVHLEYYVVSAFEDGLVFHGDVYDYEEELLDDLEEEVRQRWSPDVDPDELID